MPENFKESSDPIADFTSSLIEISKECIPQTSTNPTKSNPWYNDDKESSDPIADFTSSLIEISKECIPQTSTNPTKSNPWYNDDCKEAIKQRKQALSKSKKSPNTNNFNDIKEFRAKARRTIKLSKCKSWRSYVSKINHKTPIKRFGK